MPAMTAAKAKKLQQMLNQVAKPKPPLDVDGIIGKKTEAAIKLLQGMGGIKKTGVIDAQTAALISRAMKTGKLEKEQPEKFYQAGGATVGVTERQYNDEKKKLIRGLKSGPLAQMRSVVVATESEWEHMNDLNKDQWFVSFCIETTRRVELPPKSMIKKARKQYEACAAAVNSGDLQKFHKIAPRAEKIINDAAAKMGAYRDAMIDGGGNWVTALNFTQTASFTFIGVFAAPVAGATLGTGVVASAVVGGAAASATQTAASEIGNWSAGKANWTPGGAIKRTLIDAGVGGVLGVFAKGGAGGKHVIEAMTTKVMPQLAKQTGFKLLSSTTIKKATVYLVTEGGKKSLEGAVKDTAEAIKGDSKVTMDKFMGNLANNFISGAALGPMGKVIEKFAKNASRSLAPADKKRVWDLVLKELSKQAKGETIHIDSINNRAQALIEKTINDQIAKQLDNVLDVVYDNWKGPMSPEALQKKVSETLTSGGRDKKIAAEAAKAAKKAVKEAA